MSIIKLVLIRHGESKWNYENRFTGWADIDLSANGKIEAKQAGQLLKSKGYLFDFAYTSVLKRAIHTLWYILDEIDQVWLPIEKTWRLNERHYGALQGLNKDEVIRKYGDKLVKQWRRSFNVIPPKINRNNKYFPGYDMRYNKLTSSQLPTAESLSLTVDRIFPFWRKIVLPRLINGERIIIVAHGNSIRAMLKFIDHISNKDILELNIPNGIPLIYEFKSNIIKPIKNYYLSSNLNTKLT